MHAFPIFAFYRGSVAIQKKYQNPERIVAFNFLIVSYKPGQTVNMPRLRHAKTHKLLMKEARKVYMQRGEVGRHTQWTTSQIIEYMVNQVATVGPEEPLGGTAATLPKAQASPKASPARLRPKAKASQASLPREAPYPTMGTVGIPDTFPESGYILTFQAGSKRPWMIQHPDHEFGFAMLPDKYMLYQDSEGADVILGEKRPPIYVQDMLTLEAGGVRTSQAWVWQSLCEERCNKWVISHYLGLKTKKWRWLIHVLLTAPKNQPAAAIHLPNQFMDVTITVQTYCTFQYLTSVIHQSWIIAMIQHLLFIIYQVYPNVLYSHLFMDVTIPIFPKQSKQILFSIKHSQRKCSKFWFSGHSADSQPSITIFWMLFSFIFQHLCICTVPDPGGNGGNSLSTLSRTAFCWAAGFLRRRCHWKFPHFPVCHI